MPTPTLVLLTVNDHETDALLAVFPPQGYETRGGITYTLLGELAGMRLVHTISEMGHGAVGAAQQRTRDAIDHWSPVAVVAVGVAFGMDETKQKIGDVLVATHVQDYELGRLDEDGSLTPRGQRAPSSDPWTNRLRHTDTARRNTESDWPKVRFGVLLSGQKLVDNLDYRDTLRKQFGETVGGEMEAQGVYVSATAAKVDWAVVKAICDWGHGKNHSDKDAWQKLAARNAARVVQAALKLGPLYATPSTSHHPGQARDPGAERAETSPAPRALPAGPAADEVDLEKKLAEVLAKGPEKLVAKLDAHLTTPVPLPNLTPVARVAKKLLHLGKGADATATMLDAGFHAWQELAKTVDYTPARERVRELAGVWLPWGYAARERVKIVQRLKPSDESSHPRTMEPCDDLDLMVIRPDFAEVFVALVDRRAPSFRTEHGGPAGPRQLVSPLALTLPPSLVELKLGQWRQDFKDSIARLLVGEMGENRRLWYRAANAMAAKLRKVHGTERYLPFYVLVRGLDQQRGFTTDDVEDIKKTFPALRIVVLMREPGDDGPCPEFLLLDSDLLPNLRFIFEDPAT